MRIATLADLRASKVYKSLASLAKMPAFRQQRFLEVFNKIFALTTKRGAAEDVAEANAAAIAILAAERFTPTPATATLETEEHYFATMAEFQYSRGGEMEINDFSFVLENLDTVNAAVEGNAFNLAHNHAEPTGIVRRIVKPADVPAHIREKHPDAPFFTVGSYYADTPDDIRALQMVSAEWLQSKAAADGSRKVILPDTFALTENAATPQVLGVGKVATIGVDGKSFEAGKPVEGTRDSMPPTVQELEAKVATLQKEAEASKESATALTDLQKKHADLEKVHKDFVAKAATLAGKTPEESKKVPQDEVLTGLQARYAELDEKIKAMQQASEKKEAEAWADTVVKSREIAMDAKPKLASLYLTAKQSALDLENSLPKRVLQPGVSDANIEVEALDDKKAEEQLDFIGKAF